MIRFKFEVEEQEIPLPIGSKNVDSPSDNNGMTNKSPEENVVPKKKPKQLDNSTTDSVAVGSKSIKTEPVESMSLPTTPQFLNYPSLNIPGFSIPNCSQYQTIDSELDQSIQQQQQLVPNGTEQQQQQQSVFSITFERIVPENHQKVPSSLDQNSLTNVAFDSRLIKIETAESLSSTVSQLLNHPSLNIQSLMIPNCSQLIIDSELDQSIQQQQQSVPNGTEQQQQQQQSFVSITFEPIAPDNQEVQSVVQSSSNLNGTQQQQSIPKIEPIVSEIHQEVPLSLDQSCSIPNLNSGETTNWDTSEVPFLDQSSSILNPNSNSGETATTATICDTAEDLLSLDQSSSNPIGTEQQQQSLILPKIEPIAPEIQEVSFLDQNSSIANLYSNFGETTTTTTTNCDITTTEMFPGSRAGLGRRAKLNVCYTVPTEPNPVSRKRNKLPKPSFPFSADNSELASNDNDQHSGSGSISGFDPSASASTSSTTAEVAAPSAEAAAVPLLVGKKPLRRAPRVPLLTLEEKKERHKESCRLWYLKNKSNLKLVVPKVRAEKHRYYMEKESEEQRLRRLKRQRQYRQKRKQQLLDSGTPEQMEQMRLKNLEAVRRHMEKETEEQRKQRLERQRQYKQKRRKQLLDNGTPEQLEQWRLKDLERVRRKLKNETEEQRQRRLERVRQYKRTVRKQRRMELEQKTMTVSKTKKKSGRKHFELSMSIDSDSSHFDIDSGGGGSGEKSNGQTITTLQSPKPGPSKKLPRPTRCQRNLKSKIYFEPSTDSDEDSD